MGFLENLASKGWTRKIKKIQERLVIPPETENLGFSGLEEYLLAANMVACHALSEDRTSWKNYWEFHHLKPVCKEFCTYTYAAFLSIAPPELHPDLRVSLGYLITDKEKVRGWHGWVDFNREGWKPFETVPSNQGKFINPRYQVGATFQIGKFNEVYPHLLLATMDFGY